ncbi:TPA: YIP1 family protein [Bacillus mycoides]|uniref:Yip1 family protein n=1 Tax=Bacillus sp. FSL M7-1431 TaxID=2978219 RepID=UPI0030F55419|nr:YIP1 family protein [Bacillus mycoides]
MEGNVNKQNVNKQDVGVRNPSLLGIIISPGVQFERMKIKSPVWGAFFLFIVIAAILSVVDVYQAVNHSDVIRNVPSAEEATMVKYITIGTGIVSGLFGTAIWFFVAVGFYKVVMMFMGNDTPYMRLLSIYLHAYVITCLGRIANLIIRTVFGGEMTTTYTSLGSLFETGTVTHGIASAFDVFSLWALVVMGLGLKITAGLSKKQATMLIVILFIFSVAFSSLGGLIPNFGV